MPKGCLRVAFFYACDLLWLELFFVKTTEYCCLLSVIGTSDYQKLVSGG